MIVLKLAGILRFIKRISKEFNYTYKMLYVAYVWLGWEYASCVWSSDQEVYSVKIERIKHNFIKFALRGLS
jgi:hypothetical protein